MTIFPGRWHAAPLIFEIDNRIIDLKQSKGELCGASTEGGVWRRLPAKVPSPKVIPPGPFDTLPSSGIPVGNALAAYPRPVARFEQDVLYRHGPAQVGFDDAVANFLLSYRLTV